MTTEIKSIGVSLPSFKKKEYPKVIIDRLIATSRLAWDNYKAAAVTTHCKELNEKMMIAQTKRCPTEPKSPEEVKQEALKKAFKAIFLRARTNKLRIRLTQQWKEKDPELMQRLLA